MKNFIESEKKSFVLYDDYEEHIRMLSDEEAGSLFKALFEYRRTDETPENLTGATKMAFSFIKTNIDRDYEKWLKIKAKRQEAGKRGGIASGESRKKSAEENEANEADDLFA